MSQARSDVLYGAAEIAEHLFGSKAYAQRVWDLKRRSKVPFFKLGGTICARISVLDGWIQRQEAANSGGAANDRGGPDAS